MDRDREKREWLSGPVCSAGGKHLHRHKHLQQDRDTDPALASIGGSYELATVPRDDGEPGYFIIYLGGARPGSQWRPGEVKGILSPTIFSHHYDLVWLDEQGLSMTAEQSATFDASGALLTLSFPLYKATVRFSRRPAAQ